MDHKFIILSFLAATLALAGCQSGVTNVGVSRGSETGQAITSLNDTERQYQKNVAIYRQAMTDYEKAQGRNCGRIMFSSIVGPIETPQTRVQIYKLQGSSSNCGYQNYKAKIAYADDACHIVTTVEILERTAP